MSDYAPLILKRAGWASLEGMLSVPLDLIVNEKLPSKRITLSSGRSPAGVTTKAIFLKMTVLQEDRRFQPNCNVPQARVVLINQHECPQGDDWNAPSK